MKHKKAAAAAVLCLLTSTVTAANLIVSAASAIVATAASTKLTYGELTYQIVDEHHIEITACSSKADVVEIPSEIDGLPVTTIAATAFFRTNVTSVTIPDSVTTIGGGAFWHCQSLTSVNIPSSVQEIKNNAFTDCPLLEEIDIPETVTYIGANSFDQTAWMTARKSENPFVVVNGTVLDASQVIDNILAERQAAAEAEAKALEEAGIILIRTNDQEEKDPFVITFPSDVTGIGECVFGDFKHAIYVEEIIIPEGVTTIGKDAFSLCQECYRIELPSTLSEVGDNAFASTPWLKSHPTENGMFIVNGLLIDAKETAGDVCIPSSVKKICGYAFNANTAVTSVTFADSVTEIGDYAFKKCTELKRVTLPETLKTIGREAFIETGLESLTIPSSVKEIGYRAFITCNSLVSATVFSDDAVIGEEAFGYKNTFTLTGQYTHVYILTKNNDFVLTCRAGSTTAAYAEANEMVANTNHSGDVNNDMRVSIADVVLLERYLEETEGVTLSEAGYNNADMNADAVLDALDTTLILKKIARIVD